MCNDILGLKCPKLRCEVDIDGLQMCEAGGVCSDHGQSNYWPIVTSPVMKRLSLHRSQSSCVSGSIWLSDPLTWHYLSVSLQDKLAGGDNCGDTSCMERRHYSISSVEHYVDGSVKKIISLSLKLLPRATLNICLNWIVFIFISISNIPPCRMNISIYFH